MLLVGVRGCLTGQASGSPPGHVLRLAHSLQVSQTSNTASIRRLKVPLRQTVLEDQGIHAFDVLTR